MMRVLWPASPSAVRQRLEEADHVGGCSRVLEIGGVVKGSGAIRILENPFRDWLEGRLRQTFNRPCTHSHCV